MTPDALRERVADACLVCGRTLDQHDRGFGVPTCRGIAVPTFRSRQAALDATPLAEMREEIERLREALASVRDWADAWPVERFQEPDLAEVHAVLADNNMGNQVDRMHASWARHLTEGIGNVARAALGDGKVVT